MMASAFIAHPYQWPVIGWMADIGNITRDDLATSIIGRYYAPNNATIVVVGDFDTKKLLPRIEKYFGAHPRGAGASQGRRRRTEAAGRAAGDRKAAGGTACRICRISCAGHQASRFLCPRSAAGHPFLRQKLAAVPVAGLRTADRAVCRRRLRQYRQRSRTCSMSMPA